MALANDLVLDDVSGDDVTYRLINQDASGTRRIDLATTLQILECLRLSIP